MTELEINAKAVQLVQRYCWQLRNGYIGNEKELLVQAMFALNAEIAERNTKRAEARERVLAGLEKAVMGRVL